LKPNHKPSLFYALKLKCPYCGKTSLLARGKIIDFDRGCKPCGYRFEREIGYFSGASWMMNYTVAALMAMASGGYMVWKHSDASDFVIAGIPALIGAVAALVFIPWGRSLWMWLDHTIHPLNEADAYDKNPGEK
jgi:hypothetical protein